MDVTGTTTFHDHVIMDLNHDHIDHNHDHHGVKIDTNDGKGAMLELPL